MPSMRAVDQAVGGHFLDVLAIDRGERRGEDAVLLRDLVLPGEHAAEEAADQRRKDHREQRHREESGITHDRIVTDQVLRAATTSGRRRAPVALDPLRSRFL